MIGFWHACLKTLAVGFIYSYFWSAATAIYYVLRKDEDGTEMNEVTYEEPAEARGLPPLTTDSHGCPRRERRIRRLRRRHAVSWSLRRHRLRP